MPGDNELAVETRVLTDLRDIVNTMLRELGVKPTSFTWKESSSYHEWNLDYPFLNSDQATRGVKIKANLSLFGSTLTLKIWGYVTRPKSKTISDPESTHTLQLKSAEMPLTVANGLSEALKWAINN